MFMLPTRQDSVTSSVERYEHTASPPLPIPLMAEVTDETGECQEDEFHDAVDLHTGGFKITCQYK